MSKYQLLKKVSAPWRNVSKDKNPSRAHTVMNQTYVILVALLGENHESISPPSPPQSV
jgi:hypothetical protein